MQGNISLRCIGLTPWKALPRLLYCIVFFSLRLTPAACYTFLWNLVHFCAGVVPMTTVEEPEAVYEPPAGQKDRFGYAAVDVRCCLNETLRWYHDNRCTDTEGFRGSSHRRTGSGPSPS